MTRPFARPSGTIGVRAALGAVALCGVVATSGCPGTIDPSLMGGTGTAGTSGSGGSGPPPNVCDAPNMVFATTCATVGCHPQGNTLYGGGLDLSPSGVVGRLLNKGPSTNTNAGASCMGAGKPYLVGGSTPAQGLLLDKMDMTKVTCGSVMPQVGTATSAQITCLNAWATAVTTGVITQ
jgi:hypothetical protein